MAAKPAPVCREHNVAKEWVVTTFVYSDEDISVCIPGIHAWVCPEGGESSFPPETVDQLIPTVRELLATARKARERRSELTQFIVSVGQREVGAPETAI